MEGQVLAIGCLGFCVSFVTWQHGSPPGIQVELKSMLSKMVNTHTHYCGLC